MASARHCLASWRTDFGSDVELVRKIHTVAGCRHKHARHLGSELYSGMTRCPVSLNLKRWCHDGNQPHAARISWVPGQESFWRQEWYNLVSRSCPCALNGRLNRITLCWDSTAVANVYIYVVFATVPVSTRYSSRLERVPNDSSTTSWWWLAPCAARSIRRSRTQTTTSTVRWSALLIDNTVATIIYGTLDSSTTSFGASLRACLYWFWNTGPVVHGLVRLLRVCHLQRVETYLRSLVDSGTPSLGGLVLFLYAEKIEHSKAAVLPGGACSCSRGHDGTGWEGDSSTTSVAASGCADERSENYHGSFAGCWVLRPSRRVLRAGEIRAPPHRRPRALRGTWFRKQYFEAYTLPRSHAHRYDALTQSCFKSWQDSNITSRPLRGPLQKPGICGSVFSGKTLSHLSICTP